MSTRTLVTAAALAALLTALATRAVSVRPRLGWEGALRWNEFTIDSDFGDLGIDPKFRFAGAFGGVAAFDVLPSLSIGTGVRWHRDVERIEFEFRDSVDPSTVYTLVTRTRLESIGLPLRAEWRPARGGLRIEGSTEIAWLATAHSESRFDDVPPYVGPGARGSDLGFAQIFERVGTLDGNVTDNFRRWNVSLGAGVGWEIPTPGTEHVAVRLHGSHGLTHNMRSGEVRRYTRAVELGAEVTW